MMSIIDKIKLQIKEVIKAFLIAVLKISKWIAIIISLLIFIPFTYCQFKYPSYSYKYKMVVEVETPDGLKTGSAVSKVKVRQNPEFLRSIVNSTETDIIGEGVIVDITADKTLFVTTSPDYNGSRPHDFLAYNLTPPENYKYKSFKYYARLKDGAKAVLSMDRLPKMAYFEDIDDPKTVKQVTVDNMEEIFGPGVRLKQITVETTSERMRWKMKNRLKWLPEYYSKLLDGKQIHIRKAEDPFANSLGSGSFSSKK